MSYGRNEEKTWKLHNTKVMRQNNRDTKNLSLEKDLEDIQSTARKVGWSEEEKSAKLWKQLEGGEQ